MKYGDFSSLVQLGVGLHLGTALLQLYGDIGLQPLVRALHRARRIIESNQGAGNSDLVEKLAVLESDFDIFRIRLSNTIKQMVAVNTIFAAVLTFCLVFLAYAADQAISAGLSIVLVLLSLAPAMITTYLLWKSASLEAAPLKKRADALENEGTSSS